MRMSGNSLAVTRQVIFLCVVVFVLVMPWLSSAAEPVGTPTTDLRELRAEHQRVLDELNSADSRGRHLELDDERVPTLLKKGWDLAGTWAAAYLEAHPAPSKSDLAHIFQGFAPEPRGVKSQYGDFLEYPDYPFTGDAVRIAPSVYVVEARYFRDTVTGTFMVVARGQDGHFQALWNIKDLAEKHYAERDEIGRWVHLVRRAYYNGPLNVNNIFRIYPAANGHARFAVDAYQSADGGTILGQLSIWEWDGTEARPLLIKLHQYAADYANFHFDGKMFRIVTKEEEGLRSFFSCGMCPEPRGVWTVRVTRTGVQDLGHRFLQPEYQWADELLSKVQDGEDISNLAEKGVAEAVKARIEERKAKIDAESRDSSEDTHFFWGMLDRIRVLRRGPEGAFELDLDEAQFRFSYVRHNGKPYFRRVVVSDPQ
jgi:hypothetical protein